MVRVLEKTYRRGSEPSSEWRRMMMTIGKLLAQGSCKRMYPHADLPYKNRVPVPPKLIHTDKVTGVQKVHVGVAERYVKEEAFSVADTVVYTTDAHGDINAFALLRFNYVKNDTKPEKRHRRIVQLEQAGYKTMEIIVVCSLPGASAKPIILKALELARSKEKERRYVFLHALRHVLEYYPRFGFKLHDIENGDNVDGWLMLKNTKANKSNWHPATKPRTTLPPAPVSRPLSPPRRPPTQPPISSTPALGPKSKYPSSSHPLDSKSNIVWAKYKNYPWWPAQMIQPTEKHSRTPHAAEDVAVVFFDKHNSVGWIPKSSILPYRDPKSQRFRYTTNRDLLKAIRDADEAYRIFF